MSIPQGKLFVRAGYFVERFVPPGKCPAGIDWILPTGNTRRMEALREYLNSLSVTEQADFAARCETSIGYLRKAISIEQSLGESLVIKIERESLGAVRCEDLRPDVDWQYLRNSGCGRRDPSIGICRGHR